MADSPPVVPAAPGHTPPRRRVASSLVVAGMGVVLVLLCALMIAWSLVEVNAHDVLSWDPPPLHPQSPTATPTVTPLDPSALAALSTPTVPPTVLPSPLPTDVPAPTAPAADPPTMAPTDTPLAPTATASPPPVDASRPLLGHRIALDPGHGPRDDLGAVYVDPQTNRLVLSEDVVNLDVAKLTRNLLEARGADVFLTRETKDDFTTPWPSDVNGDGIAHGTADDLQWRTDEMNAFGAEVFLSIHANSHQDPNKRQGIQSLACITDGCLFPAQARRLATLTLDHLQAELAAVDYPITAREFRNDVFSDFPGDPPGHLFMTGPAKLPNHPRAANMPGITIEALYITSPIEMRQLQQPTVRQAIAKAYAGALEEYLLTK